MQNSAKYSAPAHRRSLHRERCSYAPLAAHSDSEESPHHQEKSEVRRKSAKQLDDGKINDVGHQWNAATVAIGQQSEDQGSHRAHRECRRQRAHDLAFGNAELVGERVDQENDNEEIKSVERPAEKTGENRVTSIRFGINGLFHHPHTTDIGGSNTGVLSS